MKFPLSLDPLLYARLRKTITDVALVGESVEMMPTCFIFRGPKIEFAAFEFSNEIEKMLSVIALREKTKGADFIVLALESWMQRLTEEQTALFKKDPRLLDRSKVSREECVMFLVETPTQTFSLMAPLKRDSGKRKIYLDGEWSESTEGLFSGILNRKAKG